jgi:hypothetical protein
LIHSPSRNNLSADPRLSYRAIEAPSLLEAILRQLAIGSMAS